MDTQIDKQGRVSVVRSKGRLDFSAAADFQARVDQALAGDGAAPAAVIIDAAGLEYVSSAGLRVFLVGARNAKGAGVGFGVCGLVPAVSEVFALSGFDRIIKVSASVDDAIAASGAGG